MFDFHLHSSVSFDSEADALDMAKKARNIGLREICFTDHYDYNSDPRKEYNLFTLEKYNAAYDNLSVEGVAVRRGVEFGLTVWNKPELDDLLQKRDFDFVIGSVHFAGGYDPYDEEYWLGKTVKEAFRFYLEEIYKCVKVHNKFDVLGHLTYVCKSSHNPTGEAVKFSDFSDITDEIMKILIAKGKGMEINTSGVDRVADFLPSADYLRRFKELGGEIVTVGSDSHDCARIGQYIPEAIEILKDIFGFVCTFEGRKPIFHKL